MRATNATGNGAWSAVSNFTTAAPAGDTTAPTLSGVPSFSAITSSGYTVTWTAGTDAVGVTGYEVQVASGGWTNVGNMLTTAIAGRTAGATETVQVRAYDAAGNRSAAISANVTLASAVVTGTITVADPLKNNTGTVRASRPPNHDAYRRRYRRHWLWKDDRHRPVGGTRCLRRRH